MAALKAGKWLPTLSEADEISSDLTALIGSLDTNEDTLDRAAIDQVAVFADTIETEFDDATPKYVRRFPKMLRALATAEGSESPYRVALTAIGERSPDFILFGDEERTLQSAYDLQEVSGDPPRGLANLARLANINLASLHSAQSQDDHGIVETMVVAANIRLQTHVSGMWGQSSISVRLRLDGMTLRVLVESEAFGFWPIAERSDGLRAFVALAAFLAAESATRPVLLIDEAEAHLHYDAQADLVQMLQNQTLASQVIYTTHSAGCLPEDLTAVRTIVPIEDEERSVIRNWFWEDGEPGYYPLLMGMGAATLAFVPTRYTVIAEGPTDFILLPRLLKDAADAETLGFQVAPGLAQADAAEIGALDLQAARIVYVVDNDEGGRAHRRKLERQGIETQRILDLSQKSGRVIEDLVRKEIYVEAVNRELHMSGHTPIDGSLISDALRPTKLAHECNRRGVGVPSKRAIAQQILEIAREDELSLPSPGAVQELLSLIDRINALLHPAQDG